MRVEAEYEPRGAWAYFAALDVHRAKLFGWCERKTGIAPFERLVAQVMGTPPYNEGRRVFWIMDNGSSHRGATCVARLQDKHPRLVPVHGPVHASWLNQIEIHFSIVQRKVLTPNDFGSLATLEKRLLDFQNHCEALAQPFTWTVTRRASGADATLLDATLARLWMLPIATDSETDQRARSATLQLADDSA
jgi:hypothetical protein